uniref:Semaphorin 3D n=1 Tax=Pseudonaja textilis TaxID=8673 RepID=A0A670YKB0_PSETE
MKCPQIPSCINTFPFWGTTKIKNIISLSTFYFLDLLRSNSSRLLLNSETDLAFQSLLLDEKRAWLMVGAKDRVILLHLDSPNREPQEVFWPAPNEQVKHCRLAGKNPETECANFIRFLQRFNHTHVFACGTGSYQPVCAFIQLRAGAKVNFSHQAVYKRKKMQAFYPWISLLGFLDGELYSGTSTDFMGSNAAFFRTHLDRPEQNYIRTEQNQDDWLNEPVFIEAHAIPDTYSHEDDKVYIFFRETAVEAGQWEKRRIHARVARVCKNDIGGKHSLINRWTTFLKARLICSIPGLQGTETHFDQLEDVFLLQTRNIQNPLVFGLFTVSSGIFSGSAVCVYSLAAIRAAFNGPFAHKEGFDYQWAEYKGRIPYPRPGTCPSETYDPFLQSTKDFPDEVISFMRTHHLMWDPIYPLHRKPVLIRVNVPFGIRHLLVDRVETEAGHVDVLFLGTGRGVQAKMFWSYCKSRFEMRFDSCNGQRKQELFVSTAQGLVQLSMYRCELYGKTCADCCLARDPYCTWDGKSCRAVLLTKKRRAQCPNVLKTNPINQCLDAAKGELRSTPMAEEKVIFGVQNNSTFLECHPLSPQTKIRWLVQRSNTIALEKNTGRFSILEQGLLINQLTQQDAGLYQCQGMDSSFSQTLTYYKLRIIGQQAMEAVTSKLGKNAETKGNHHSGLPPVSGLQLPYKGYSWASGTNLVEFCNALQQRKRLRPKVWTSRWQQHPSESKKGRVRRHPPPSNRISAVQAEYGP